MALVPSPQWLDTGDNAWQLAAATFVGLQSVPGLTVLYGGIVKKKMGDQLRLHVDLCFRFGARRLGSL
jgi:ammonia channel protein AmtB